MTAILELLARMVSCILDGIPHDVVQLIVNEIDHFTNQGDTHLFFPSLITGLQERGGG